MDLNYRLETSKVGFGLRVARQNVAYSDFTDNEDTTGSLTMTPTIPEGAFMVGCKVFVQEGFTGDTTAVMTIGKSDTEDEFSDGTSVNIYTAATVGDSVEDPLEYISSETSIYLTVTGGADFTSISAGKMQVNVYYLSTEPEQKSDYPLLTAL